MAREKQSGRSGPRKSEPRKRRAPVEGQSHQEREWLESWEKQERGVSNIPLTERGRTRNGRVRDVEREGNGSDPWDSSRNGSKDDPLGRH